MANVVIPARDLLTACAEARKRLNVRAQARVAAFEAEAQERAQDLADAHNAGLGARILRRVFGLQPLSATRFKNLTTGFRSMSQQIRMLAEDILRDLRITNLAAKVLEDQGGLVEITTDEAALIDLDPRRLPKPFQAPQASA